MIQATAKFYHQLVKRTLQTRIALKWLIVTYARNLTTLQKFSANRITTTTRIIKQLNNNQNVNHRSLTVTDQRQAVIQMLNESKLSSET